MLHNTKLHLHERHNAYTTLLQETEYPLFFRRPFGDVDTALEANARIDRVDRGDDGFVVAVATQVEDGAKLRAETVPER